jgi:ribonuclease-3
VKETVKWINKSLNYKFNDEALLALALTHRSLSSKNNERLEFLGDSILSIIISDLIYREKSLLNEGDLTRLRAYLVKESTLCQIAKNINLSIHINVGAGENKSGTRYRCSVLSDTLEALLGAIYLDSGFENTFSVIQELYKDVLSKLPSMDQLKDSKTRLQEIIQKESMNLPEYSIANITGQDHLQKFYVKCIVKDRNLITQGEGISIRKAEQDAAALMIEKYNDSDLKK